MKICLLTLVLIGVNYASAQKDSSQAWEAQLEANYYINSLKTRAVFQKDTLRNNLVTQTYLLINQIIYTKNILAARFWIFGSKAQAQRTIWMGSMDDLSGSLKYQLSFDSVDSILAGSLNGKRETFLDPRYPEIESLKTVINTNVALIKCWNTSKEVIKSLTDKLIAQVILIINTEEMFSTTILKLKSCNSDEICGYGYIQANYPKLLSDIKTGITAASKALRFSIGNIFGNITSTTKAIEDEYKAGPRAQITACLAMD